jgi:DNA replication factor GINS
VAEPISFEVIRKIEREETSSPTLTKLPENFYQKVMDYIKLKKRAEKEGRKVVTEIRNIERLVKAIFMKRERKIVDSALKFFDSNIVPENMTPEEKKFFNQIVEILKGRRDGILRKILIGREKVKLIIFREDVPEFVGSDEKTYGPFKKGDIAKLPEEEMKVLVEQGLAEEFEIEK